MESISLLRNLSLVVGATILSVYGANILYLFPEGSLGNLVLFLLAVFLLLYGFGSIDKIIYKAKILIRNSHIFGYRVAIICGVYKDFNCDIPKVWTDISPNDWKNEIEKMSMSLGKKIKVKLIYANESFDLYNAIINPYGGNYPETSFDGFPVYNKLLNYIRRGGLFVNVADIPTYWAYNPNLKRKLDRTPAVYAPTGQELRFFQCVPLMQELALRVINIEQSEPVIWQLKILDQYNTFNIDIINIIASRAVFIEGNVEPVTSPIHGNETITPLFFCNYGDGRCLISLSFLNDKFIQNLPLKEVISGLLIDQLTK